MTNESIINGTNQPQDLIPALLNLVRDRVPSFYEAFCSQSSPVPSSEWWDSEEAQYLVEQLIEILDRYAPEGYYFGPHEGNQSDFGFWPVDKKEESGGWYDL